MLFYLSFYSDMRTQTAKAYNSHGKQSAEESVWSWQIFSSLLTYKLEDLLDIFSLNCALYPKVGDVHIC